MTDPEEWLAAIYAAAGPDADHAKELIERLDEAEAASSELHDLLHAFDNDTDGAIKAHKEHESLLAWAEGNELIGPQPGESLEERLAGLVAQYERLEAQSFALSELAMAAGLIQANDYRTDPLPLIRMFLPE